jgi:hypothetical protein
VNTAAEWAQGGAVVVFMARARGSSRSHVCVHACACVRGDVIVRDDKSDIAAHADGRSMHDPLIGRQSGGSELSQWE